jgi:hypothetical protein
MTTNENKGGELGTRMLGRDSWDRKAWAGQQEKTVWMAQAGQEKEDGMVRT